MPMIIVFSATMSVLYYLGVAQVIIKQISLLLHWILGTSPVESFVATASIVSF